MVEFDSSGQVILWDNSGGNLKLSSLGPDGSTFTVGATQARVLAAQGNPVTITTGTYSSRTRYVYGSSMVEFDSSGQVILWDNSGGNLNLTGISPTPTPTPDPHNVNISGRIFYANGSHGESHLYVISGSNENPHFWNHFKSQTCTG